MSIKNLCWIIQIWFLLTRWNDRNVFEILQNCLTYTLDRSQKQIEKKRKKREREKMMNDDNIDRFFHWIVQKAIRRKEKNRSAGKYELFDNDICWIFSIANRFFWFMMSIKKSNADIFKITNGKGSYTWKVRLNNK